MNCDPNALANAARCYSCLPPAVLNEVDTYLLCQAAAKTSGASAFASLVHYWPLNESSGIRIDYVGNLWLLETSPVPSAAGKIGLAADFTHSPNGRLEVNSATRQGLSTTLPYSFAFWSRFPVNLSVLNQATFTVTSTDPVGGIWAANGDSPSVFAYIGFDGSGDNMSIVLTNSKTLWQLTVISIDGTGTASAYSNGALVDSGFMSPSIVTGGSVYVGSNPVDPNGNFPAGTATPLLLNSLMIFNTALTPQQVTELWNHGEGRFPSYPSRAFPYSVPAPTAWLVDSNGPLQFEATCSVKPPGDPDVLVSFIARWSVAGAGLWTQFSSPTLIPSSQTFGPTALGAHVELQIAYCDFGTGTRISDWSSSKFFTVV